MDELGILKDSAAFSVHHIGGRGGPSTSFPAGSKANADIVYVVYDADADCIEQIVDISQNEPSPTMVLPYAVGEIQDHGTLYLTYDPYMSSILEPIQYTGLSYPYPGVPYDYVVDDALRVVEKRKVELMSLDFILAKHPEIPKPQFLSIDTQGSELSILKGAKKTLETVVAVMVEVEFTKIYKDQPLFGEVHDFLLESGFVLMDLEHGIGTTPSRGPVGARAKGQLSWGDALYFRKPENAERSALAFIALSFGYADYARSCFPIAEVVYPSIHELLTEFESLVASLKTKLPPTFSDKYSANESRARFSNDFNQENSKERGARLRNIRSQLVKVLELLRIKSLVKKLYYSVDRILFERKMIKLIQPMLRFSEENGLRTLKRELTKQALTR